MRAILILSRQAGFRRAGRAHPAGWVCYPVSDFTDEQLQALAAEPMLEVEPVYLPEDPDELDRLEAEFERRQAAGDSKFSALLRGARERFAAIQSANSEGEAPAPAGGASTEAKPAAAGKALSSSPDPSGSTARPNGQAVPTALEEGGGKPTGTDTRESEQTNAGAEGASASAPAAAARTTVTGGGKGGPAAKPKSKGK